MNKPYLSVILPAYNEEANFKRGRLKQAYDYLKSQDYFFEMVLVDDGSTDKTLELLSDFAESRPEIRVIAGNHGGKGPAVLRGMLAATGENRLFADFDQSTPISEVEKLLPFRKKGYDVIIGSREVKGSKREKEPRYRHLMGRVFNLVVQIFAVRGVNDTQCGFKLFSQAATETLFPKLKVTANPKKDAFTGAFDVELLFLAQKYEFLVAEVPVFWKHYKTKRVSPIKDSLRMFLEVVRIRFANINGVYND